MAKRKNELERFTNKCGYNEVWAKIKEWIEEYSNKLDIGGNDNGLYLPAKRKSEPPPLVAEAL